MLDFSIEEKFHGPVIGLDEVGRGPLAGPVISCGCYFKNYTIQKEFSNFIGDSKKLSAKKREASFKFLQVLKKDWVCPKEFTKYISVSLSIFFLESCK